MFWATKQDNQCPHASSSGFSETHYKLSSLQLFYATMENHGRAMESLARFHKTYKDLLVPIVLGKLPSDMQTNLGLRS